MKIQQGFTLIELIITIILIGILATTVAPKFFSSEGYQAYTYRADIINKLRAIQLRAMQQTSGTHCHQVLIKTKQIGLPDKNCTVDPETSDFSSNWKTGTTGVKVEGGHDVTFSGDQSRIIFNSLGQPIIFTALGQAKRGCQINATGSTGCLITINGAEALIIKIEYEGYIHAP